MAVQGGVTPSIAGLEPCCDCHVCCGCGEEVVKRQATQAKANGLVLRHTHPLMHLNA
jgi:hypothetical protein